MTSKNITLTIPNDDAIALHEFGAAMQRMAGRHGLEQVTPTAATSAFCEGVEQRRYTVVDTDKAQLAALGSLGQQITAALNDDDAEPVTGVLCERDTIVTSSPQVDSDGLPWDARIHASSKERNSDDTWRARRKPADMEAGQWAEFQGQVRAELRALMAVPVEQEVAVVLDEQPVEVTPGEPKVASLTAGGELSVGYSITPVVVEPVEPEPIVVAPPVVEPVAPVVVTPPPVVVTPPPVAAGPTEFVPFLQWITAAGHTTESVAPFLAKHGLTEVKQLQQRPDLIPQVHASIVAGM